MDEWTNHEAFVSASRFPTADDRRQRRVNHIAWLYGLGSPWRGMPSRSRAGGCFLTICILAGFPLGLAIGNPMKGVLIGTGVGIVLAVATWLIDRGRQT
jgi:hypothetical protein